MRKFKSENIKKRTDLIYELGLEDSFEKIMLKSKEEHAIYMCNQVIEFHKKYGKYPSSVPSKSEEHKMGVWLAGMRLAKQGKLSNIFYPILEKMAIDAGYPDMFNNIGEQNAIDKCNQVIEFKKKHGRYPRTTSKDYCERKLGQWLSNMRTAKQGKGRNKQGKGTVFYPILEKMSVDAGCSDMFNNREREAIDKCNQVIEFIKKYGRYPNRRSEDEYERKLRVWLTNMRLAKQGNAHGTFYSILEKMAVDAGYPDMFNNIDKEQEAIDKCNEVIEFIKKYGRYPSTMSTDEYERKLGVWLSNMRRTKQGNTSCVFYHILNQMVKKAKLPNMFNKNWKDDIKNLEELNNEKI